MCSLLVIVALIRARKLVPAPAPRAREEATAA
jgi:hypothetical protein